MVEASFSQPLPLRKIGRLALAISFSFGRIVAFVTPRELIILHHDSLSHILQHGALLGRLIVLYNTKTNNKFLHDHLFSFVFKIVLKLKPN
jgi:hypothetical protein